MFKREDRLLQSGKSRRQLWWTGIYDFSKLTCVEFSAYIKVNQVLSYRKLWIFDGSFMLLPWLLDSLVVSTSLRCFFLVVPQYLHLYRVHCFSHSIAVLQGLVFFLNFIISQKLNTRSPYLSTFNIPYRFYPSTFLRD